GVVRIPPRRDLARVCDEPLHGLRPNEADELDGSLAAQRLPARLDKPSSVLALEPVDGIAVEVDDLRELGHRRDSTISPWSVSRPSSPKRSPATAPSASAAHSPPRRSLSWSAESSANLPSRA